jgi:hypothetical protein
MGFYEFDGWGGNFFEAAAFQSFAEFTLLARVGDLTF